MTRLALLPVVTALLFTGVVHAQEEVERPPVEEAPATEEAPSAEEPSADAPSAELANERVTVVVLDLEAIDVDANKMKILNGVVTDQLAGYESLEIVAQADIRQMVDFEAEKQALGCDTTSCLSEIAGALGAGYVVFGRVGRLGDIIFVQLNLFDSAKGRAISREEVRAADLAALPDRLRVASARVVSPLTGEEPPALPDDATPASASSSSNGGGGLAMPLLIAGGATAGVGVLLAGVGGVAAWMFDEQLGDPEKDQSARTDLVNYGWGSLALAAVGGVVALAGLGVLGASFAVE